MAEKYMEYPKEKDCRVGCKVSWYYYESREDADLCSTAARHNARLDAAQGYDFGYQAPGEVTWSEARQMWSVVVP